MRRVVHVPRVYAYVGELPEGCRLCLRGVKLVVFVTGLCDDSCFYCPVSRLKLGRDLVYVDEEPARSLADVIDEAERIGAEGASITGGDPLLALKRVVTVVRLLKDYGGPGFHIHLYTSGRYATAHAVRELERAGLDEIRFHPVEPWMLGRVEAALRARRWMRVGVEIPVLPDRVEEVKEMLLRLDRMGVDFANLNELEASPDNIEALRMRGYRVRGVVAEGSYEAGLRIVEWASTALRRMSVHLCPAWFKDNVQVRARMVRKAVRTRACFEEATGHGTLRTTLVKGDARGCCGYRVSGYTLVSPSCAERVGLGGEVVEYYPSSSRLEALRQRLGVAGSEG